MPIVKCKLCSKNFYAKPFLIKKGFGKYCSSYCKHQGQRNGKLKKCFICNKETYKPQKQLNGSKSGKFFCSKSCQTRWRNSVFVGSKHANWKEGRYTYRLILKKSKKPMICNLCGISDLRVLAVHHVDENRLNNNVRNLAWLCHNCHYLVHHDNVEKQRFNSNLVK